MENKPFIKIKTSDKKGKKIVFPKDFNELIDKTKTFISIDELNKNYQFIDEDLGREIKNQEDFELFSKHKFEKPIKILVNIVDKIKKEPKIKQSFLNIKLSEEKINFNISPNLQNKEQHAENQIKKDIKIMVRNKLKPIEENIVNDMCEYMKKKLEVKEINKEEEVIHKGIKCLICQEENIKGIRYKCSQCEDFNICNNCEKKNSHKPSHILIKIRKPLKEEKELISKIDKKYKYKNREYNYLVEPLTIKFKDINKQEEILIKQITIQNVGYKNWSNFVFKCLPQSQIKGENIKMNTLYKDALFYTSLVFNNLKYQVSSSVNEYFVYYQMVTEKEEVIGNITKFRIIFT